MYLQHLAAFNSFHRALKYTWKISDTSLAFLDIKISIEGNGLCTSVYYKPTDSHSYLLYSSSHPVSGRFDTKSFRYKPFRYKSKSIR